MFILEIYQTHFGTTPNSQILKSRFTKAKCCLYRKNDWETRINLKLYSKNEL